MKERLEWLRKELQEYIDNASKGSYGNREQVMQWLAEDIAAIEAELAL